MIDVNHPPAYKIGLTLSGGGARGFAHLGVIQAMYEIGIQPNILSGTSAGSIIGAMIASGHSPKECLNFFIGKKILHFARPTMSKKGIMTMSGMEEKLAEFLQVRTFEELKIPLVVTASDINNAVPAHFEHGELLPCLIASSSIPIVFTPREINQVDYVDGGIFMNLPVRPIRKRCEKIIAVEINSIDTSVKVTNMLEMAVRSFNLGVNRNTDIDKGMCDVFIAPQNMTKYSMFDLEHVEEIYEEGYRTAKCIFKNSIFSDLSKVNPLS
ncbi:MAG: patatin-like phospholipase family protein [Odoribacter sp.]